MVTCSTPLVPCVSAHNGVVQKQIKSFFRSALIELLEGEVTREKDELVIEGLKSSWHKENAKGYNQAKRETIAHHIQLINDLKALG